MSGQPGESILVYKVFDVSDGTLRSAAMRLPGFDTTYLPNQLNRPQVACSRFTAFTDSTAAVKWNRSHSHCQVWCCATSRATPTEWLCTDMHPRNNPANLHAFWAAWPHLPGPSEVRWLMPAPPETVLCPDVIPLYPVWPDEAYRAHERGLAHATR